jgi:hypothetical protein
MASPAFAPSYPPEVEPNAGRLQLTERLAGR